MTIFERADAAVNRVGLGDHLVNHVPRHFRWTSTIALFALILGAVLLLLGMTGVYRILPIGYLFFVFAICSAAFLHLFGPLRRATPDQPLDERESDLRIRSLYIAAMTVAIAAMAGAWTLAVAFLLGVRFAATPSFWIIIAFALNGLFAIIPPFYASWATRPLAKDDQ